MEHIKGVGVSPGVVAGAALVAIQRTQVIRFPIAPAHVPRELAALERARSRSRGQLEQIRTRIAQATNSDLASIFDAQLLILEDPLLLGRAEALVRSEYVNAEWAVQRALDELGTVLDGVEDPYLHERKGDLQDVAGRLRMNMRGGRGARDLFAELDGDCILVADELTPSVVAQLDWTRILGFATDAGSRTYHTAILARSLGVPAVVGLHDITSRVAAGASVVLDGSTGEVVIGPAGPELDRIAAGMGAGERPAQPIHTLPSPAVTRDGVRVCLYANIERAEDVTAARDLGAEGIGLYRSEFLLAGGAPTIGEDEQYEHYRQLVGMMAPHPVTIRTFDVDEYQLDRPRMEAALDARWTHRPARGGHAGLRGIRFGLAQPDIFKTQLRALLRASRHGELRILFPFVSSIHEVRSAVALLQEAARELGPGAPPIPPVGIMIEVPSAALTAARLARDVAFFTIGTNDLIQYMLAVDRTDERVSDRYEPLHPSVLGLLRHVRRAARRQGIPVSICGEMASDPVLLRVLVGCGLTELSMTPGALPLARDAVRDTNAADMQRLAARLVRLDTAEDVERSLADALSARGRDEVMTR